MKKIILLILAITIVFSISACKPAGPSDSSGSGVESVDKSWLPDITLDDKKVVILSELNDKSELFTEHYGGEVELILSASDVYTTFMTMSMGGERIDLFRTVLKPILATQGYLKPIDEYIDFDNKLWADLKAPNENLRHIDGKSYVAMVEKNRTMFLWYNKELFTEFGIDDPESHVKNGTWDWNVMRQMAKDLTIERNGQYEQYGLSIDEIDAFLYSCGKHIVSFKGGEKAVNNVRSVEVARAINFYTDLITKDKVIYANSDARQAFTQGKIGMIAGGLWYSSIWPDMIRNGTAMFVPFPKDPNSDQYYVQEHIAGYMIPSTAENEKGAAAYMACKRLAQLDEGAMEKGKEDLREWGWGDTHFDMYLNQCLSSDKVGVPISYISFDIGAYYGDFFVRPSKGEPWATIAAEIEPGIDDKINLAYEAP